MAVSDVSSKVSGRIMIVAFACLLIWGVSGLADIALRLRGTHVEVLTIVWKISGWSCIPLVILAVLLRVIDRKSGSNDAGAGDSSVNGRK
jgi:hypothetical protein